MTGKRHTQRTAARERETAHVGFKIRPSELEKLKAIAEREDRTISSVVRRLVREKLQGASA